MGKQAESLVSNLDDLQDWRLRINRTIRTQMAAMQQEARRHSPLLSRFVELAREYALRGGKRFRALLLIAGYGIAGGRDVEAVLPAAAALEMFQDWMLVHDDIMDHSILRRGGPTLHLLAAAVHESDHLLGNGAAFGEAMGIILGDLFEPLAISGLRASSRPNQACPELLAEYARMVRNTAFGQVLDMMNEARPLDHVSEKEVLAVHRLKSATYTVISPLRLGGVLADAGSNIMSLYSELGQSLGIAFQLRDDIIGIGADSGGASGKSTNDITEGKRTLLVVKAWRGGSLEQRSTLSAALGRAGATVDQIRAARDVIRATGSLDYSERMITSLFSKSAARIRRDRHLTSSSKRLLLSIGEGLVHRVS